MSDINPNVSVTLGGKERNLRLDFGALEFIEEQTGFNLLTEAGWEIIKSPSAKNINALVCGMLLHEDPTITPRTVGGWIDLQNVRDVMDAVKRAVEKSSGNSGQGAPEAPVSPLSRGRGQGGKQQR